jgi:hypothetical protein
VIVTRKLAKRKGKLHGLHKVTGNKKEPPLSGRLFQQFKARRL